jgi:hypothetical protein
MIELDEIEIHHIQSVQFTTMSRRVNRHRSVKSPPGTPEPF